MTYRARMLLLRAALFLAPPALLSIAGCKPAGLPDAGSPGARLYADRCGSCHAPYDPHEMTGDMWAMQVTMMEQKIRQAGMPPIPPGDRDAIINYLKRNAGTE
ncbi:MAG TPA: cytochrome c [Candidatus Binataceae bacterium]|nr:cytochrome c [Candidatus Binataceae bacterium]